MTIHQQNNRLDSAKVDVLLQARRLRPLSIRNPWDYMRLLIWALFQPQYIKAYRIRCNIPQRQLLKKQALILTMLLVWFPLLPWLLVPWIMDNLQIPRLLMVGMLFITVGALVGSIRFGLATDQKTITGLMVSMILVPFGLTAVIAYTLQQTGTSSLWLIGFTVFAMSGSMPGIAIASIFKLKTAEKIAAAITVILGGGLATTIFSLQFAALLPISAIIIMAFLVGVIEDRYEMKMNQRGIGI